MRILIIGNSKIVQNRVLPALLKIPEVKSIDIASQSRSEELYLRNDRCGEIFKDYEEAIHKSKADLVYISVINSLHAKLAEKALKKGLHVIVDKPAFMRLSETKNLLSLAKRSKLCLAESTVYAYHPQIAQCLDIFEKVSSRPTKLMAVFSFPQMNKDNFRYSRKLGGGALMDLGPYAVSLGRIFFKRQIPKKILSVVTSRGGKNAIDTSFSVLMFYPDGSSMIGYFGFNTEYKNYLNILGEKVSISMNRTFTIPADMENELDIQKNNQHSIVKVRSCDSFYVFLKSVFSAVQSGKHNLLYDDLLADALALDRLKKSALEGK